MRRADEFTKLRPLLYAIAYRILGETRAAQYAVQAAWLRWMAAPEQPASVEGHLAAEVTRIAVRALQSARVARGEVVGPLLADSGLADPDRPHGAGGLAVAVGADGAGAAVPAGARGVRAAGGVRVR